MSTDRLSDLAACRAVLRHHRINSLDAYRAATPAQRAGLHRYGPMIKRLVDQGDPDVLAAHWPRHGIRIPSSSPPSAVWRGVRRKSRTARYCVRVRTGLRGRLLFEGVGDGLLQGHRPALGPCQIERLVTQALPQVG